MTPADWQQIADDIRVNYDKYDGLCLRWYRPKGLYSLSSFMLETGKPVIVTGFQLAELRSDGQANLLNALHIAANYPINEVTLFFNNKLMRKTMSHADGFNAYVSKFTRVTRSWHNIQISGDVEVNKLPVGTFTVHDITPRL